MRSAEIDITTVVVGTLLVSADCSGSRSRGLQRGFKQNIIS
jgi:hypothetical protein